MLAFRDAFGCNQSLLSVTRAAVLNVTPRVSDTSDGTCVFVWVQSEPQQREGFPEAECSHL